MNSAVVTQTAALVKPYPGLFKLSLTAGAFKEATVGISSGDLWKVSLDDFVILDEFNALPSNCDIGQLLTAQSQSQCTRTTLRLPIFCLPASWN